MRTRVLAALALGLACRGTPLEEEAPPRVSAPLQHEGYVWQRTWVGATEAAVRAASPALRGLRVLAVELGEDGTDGVSWVDLDGEALRDAQRPITLVVRLGGAQLPVAATAVVEGLRTRARTLRAAGVAVVALEVDHDSGTARLGEYATWLADVGADVRRDGFAWQATALPTWAEAKALVSVAAAVDEVTLQVHAVVAPSVFDPVLARHAVERYAQVLAGRSLTVALPTYEIEVQGTRRRGEVTAIATFVRWLEQAAPSVDTVAWFRLPHPGDARAWSTRTLEAVIQDEPLVASVQLRVTASDTPGLFDVALVNEGTAPGAWPRVFTDPGLVMELGEGYRAQAARAWSPPARTLAAGERQLVGWMRGPMGGPNLEAMGGVHVE